jgi:CRP-like cAMP-binding protein
VRSLLADSHKGTELHLRNAAAASRSRRQSPSLLTGKRHGPSMGSANAQSALVRRLATFVEISEEERTALLDLESRQIEVARGVDLTKEGQDGHKAFILQSGWACSYKLTPNGGRQIIRFPIPGDFMGYRALLLPTSDQFLCVMTDAVVSVMESAQLFEIFRTLPRLGGALAATMSQDEAMVVDHLTSVGRRTALERVAHFFLELAERLSQVGLAAEMSFKCPLNQQVIGDALGLSAIHVNRVLRQLRELNLMTVNAGEVAIQDQAKLEELAGYRSVTGEIRLSARRKPRSEPTADHG